MGLEGLSRGQPMKHDFTMTDDDLEMLLKASEPGLGGIPAESPQARANRVWRELGERMGFDALTVEPSHGEDLKRFKAEPLVPCKGCGRPTETWDRLRYLQHGMSRERSAEDDIARVYNHAR
jgi:hypothetical protein